MVNDRLKDRSEEKTKRDEIINFRATKSEKQTVNENATKSGQSISEYARTILITSHQRMDKPKSTRYRCDKCDKKILPNEEYYCGLANRERFVENENGSLEIDVIDSMPKLILCYACASKAKRLKQFAEAAKGTHKVAGAEREIKP